jgi:hypothetical protein
MSAPKEAAIKSTRGDIERMRAEMLEVKWAA